MSEVTLATQEEIDALERGLPIPVSPEENELAWRNGVLYHLLDSLQRQIYDFWWGLSPKQKNVVLMIGRRIGKTFTCACIAIEIALRSKTLQHYASPTSKQVKEILLPTFDIIFETCPEDLRPKWRPQEGKFVFPSTGSQILIAGCEDNKKAERLRGSYTDCAWLDEAGYINVLGYVANSIFRLMAKGRPGARVTSYSNAPLSPAHDIVREMRKAQDEGSFFHATVFDSPRWTPEEIEEEATNLGGYDSSDFIRECRAEITVDEESAVIPEWASRAEKLWINCSESIRARDPEPTDDPEEIREPLIREVERPEYYTIYTALDIGHNDLTSVLTAFQDYHTKDVVVVGERELHKITTKDVADAIRSVEEECWEEYWDFIYRNHGWKKEPYQRLMDGGHVMKGDLAAQYDIEVKKVKNQELGTQITRLRGGVREGRLIVEPQCVNLIAHLEAAYWDHTRKKFARPHKKPKEGERYYGHFDHVSAVQVLWNNLDVMHNPFPALPVGVSHRTHLIKKHRTQKPIDDGVANLVRALRANRISRWK